MFRFAISREFSIRPYIDVWVCNQPWTIYTTVYWLMFGFAINRELYIRPYIDVLFAISHELSMGPYIDVWICNRPWIICTTVYWCLVCNAQCNITMTATLEKAIVCECNGYPSMLAVYSDSIRSHILAEPFSSAWHTLKPFKCKISQLLSGIETTEHKIDYLNCNINYFKEI